MTEEDAAPIRTAGEVVAVVRSVMAEVLHDDEFGSATVRVVEQAGLVPDPTDDRVLPASERIERGEYWIILVVLGETAHLWYSAWSDDDAALSARIRSELQDFVAESAFGWGQLRE